MAPFKLRRLFFVKTDLIFRSKDLYGLVKNKDHFVLTTNVDHCFQKAGFDKNRLFYTQGDYGLFQCSEPCCQETYDNRTWMERMVTEQKDMRIPTELIPKCPRCGKPLTMNLRADHRFVEDTGWHRAAERYTEFLRSHQNESILFLELIHLYSGRYREGVGVIIDNRFI